MVRPETCQSIRLLLQIGTCHGIAYEVGTDELQLRPLFPTTKIQDPEDYDYTTLIAVVTWTLTLLSTVAISLLPSLIILWLFHVKKTITRIWITIVATICIGVLLRVLDTATIKEIFGGTAAYVSLNMRS